MAGERGSGLPPGGELPGKPRRAHPRHTLRRGVRVRVEGEESYLALETANISRGGMLIWTPEPPPVGSAVDIGLELPEGANLELSGRVVHVVYAKRGEPLSQIGVALSIGPADRAQFDRFLVQSLLARDSGQHASGSQGAPWPEPPTPPSQPVAREDMPRRLTPGPTGARRFQGPIIGIDFGTSYCSVGVVQGSEIALFPDEGGRTSIPSVVWFRGKDDHVVGAEARQRQAEDPARTVHSIKRLLGARIDNPHAVPFLMSLACPGRSGPNRSIVFDINEEELTPVQIASFILRHLKALAEHHLGSRVQTVVMAFPLAFGEQQRVDLEKAVRIAGLELASIIPEPVAAAMAYGYRGDRNELVGVYDFGGGTFDFCVLEIVGGVLRVLGAAGDPWLGGDDIDLALARVVADELWSATKIDVRKRAVEWQRLRIACEEAKCLLSTEQETDVVVPSVALTQDGPIDLSVPMSRERFNQITAEVIYLTLTVCRQALTEASVRVEDVNQLLLTGGTTRIPAVRTATRMLFGRDPHPSTHPEHAVVYGTAIRAAELEGRPIADGPAAGLIVQQVATKTVGLALAGGLTEPLIPRSTPLPAAVRRIFATTREGQTQLELRIVEGEERLSSANQSVGAFTIDGLTPGPAGAVELEIVFSLSEAGVLSVEARELRPGQRFRSYLELD